MRALIRCLLCALLVLAAGRALAGIGGPLLIASGEGEPYRALVERLQMRLAAAGKRSEVMLADRLDKAAAEHHRLLVAIGTHALRRTMQLELPNPVLTLMVPRAAFEALTATDWPQQAIARRRLSAIWLEQPYGRQLRLARLVAPGAERLGVLLGPESAEEETEIEAIAHAHGWKSQFRVLRETESPLRAIGDLIAASDLLLAVPDRAEFNRTTARWLLLLSLRERIPLIGYSRRYVEAGAVAAVFSSAETIADEAAELILAHMRGQLTELPAPFYPRRFEVGINREVAARLRLDLADEEWIRQQLEAVEQWAG